MKNINFLISFLFTIAICSCRKKETFPELSRQIEGNWNVNKALVTKNLSDSIASYNPRDSAQVARVTIRKIDPLRAEVKMLLRRQNGETIFERTFECELSRDIENKGFIRFMTYPGSNGGYNSDAKTLYVQSSGANEGLYAGISVWFEAQR